MKLQIEYLADFIVYESLKSQKLITILQLHDLCAIIYFADKECFEETVFTISKHFIKSKEIDYRYDATLPTEPILMVKMGFGYQSNLGLLVKTHDELSEYNKYIPLIHKYLDLCKDYHNVFKIINIRRYLIDNAEYKYDFRLNVNVVIKIDVEPIIFQITEGN